MNIQIDKDWWKDIFDEVYLQTDARSVCDESLTCQEVDFLEQALDLNSDRAGTSQTGVHKRDGSGLFQVSCRSGKKCRPSIRSRHPFHPGRCQKHRSGRRCVSVCPCHGQLFRIFCESSIRPMRILKSVGQGP